MGDSYQQQVRSKTGSTELCKMNTPLKLAAHSVAAHTNTYK